MPFIFYHQLLLRLKIVFSYMKVEEKSNEMIVN